MLRDDEVMMVLERLYCSNCEFTKDSCWNCEVRKICRTAYDDIVRRLRNG